jgi:hypothetical protein
VRAANSKKPPGRCTQIIIVRRRSYRSDRGLEARHVNDSGQFCKQAFGRAEKRGSIFVEATRKLMVA